MKKTEIEIIDAFANMVLSTHQKILVAEIAHLEELHFRLSVAANKNVDSLVAQIKEQAKITNVPNFVFIEKEIEFETSLALKNENPTHGYCNSMCFNDYFFLSEYDIYNFVETIKQITELRIKRTR